MPVLRLKESSIYYEINGKAKRTLFFIHGFTCDHSDWNFQVQQLSNAYRVVTCDLRGHGLSTGDESGFTIEALAGDISLLFKALGIQQTVLIGHSMGCRVALETYLQNPRTIAGIVLIDGNNLSQGNTTGIGEAKRRTIEKQGYTEYIKSTFAGMFFGDSNVKMKDRIIERALKLDPKFGINLLSNAPEWDSAKIEVALSELKVPLLVLQSTGYSANYERISLKKGDTTPWLQLVNKLVPSAKIKIMSGYGHFVMLEAPDAISKLINSFASGLKNIELHNT
ncbi:alpha/beta fold hydrolase [Chloroflexota bacterium]